MRQTYNDLAYKSFEANVPANLVGKEGYLVSFVSAASGKIELWTSGVPIGFLMNRLEGSVAWNVRMLGGGTVRAVAGGAIIAASNASASLGYVKGVSGGKVVAATAGDFCVGILISPRTAAASGDIVELLVMNGTTHS